MTNDLSFRTTCYIVLEQQIGPFMLNVEIELAPHDLFRMLIANQTYDSNAMKKTRKFHLNLF